MNKYFRIIPVLVACWLCLVGLPLRGQTFQWTKKAGPSTAAYLCESNPNKIFRDSKDNIYYCLSFANSTHLTIDGREVFKPRCNVKECCAVVCYDCEGNMKWYRTILSHSYTTTSSDVDFNFVDMVEDTLVMSFNGIFQTLYLCDSTHVLDTISFGTTYTGKYSALWMSTDNGRAIRTAYTGPVAGMSYSDNKLYFLLAHGREDTNSFIDDDSIYVQVCTPQGGGMRHYSLDFYAYPYFDKMRKNIESAVYHDKYYVLYNNNWEADSLWFGNQLYVDSSDYGNSVLACFDNTGQCLWSRLLNTNTVSFYMANSHIAIDESAGLIYIMAIGCGYDPAYPDWPYNTFDGDTLWEGNMNERQGERKLVLACYDTLGNKRWVKYTQSTGKMEGIGMSLLPGRKLAIGGQVSGDVILEGLHTHIRDDEMAAYFAIYDLAKDSFVLLQTLPKDGYFATYPYTFNADKDGNLLFAGPINDGHYIVCGDDTIYGGSSDTHVFYGRYGWPCDSAAHWPGPPPHTLTLNASPAHTGRVAGAGTYPDYTQVPVRAVPSDGFDFDHWSDGGNENPRHVLLVSDSAITAYFVERHEEPEGIAPAEAPRIALYPNPATDEVTLRGLNEPPLSIEVLDMTGRAVATFGRTATFDVSRLPQGCYIVAIQTPSSRHHLRLVRK